MEHKITYKTKDGSLREQRFDDFNQFADSIEEVANEFYAGMKPEIEVQTIHQSMITNERVTNGRTDIPSIEFLG